MVRWRLTSHGEKSYWVISIAEETKSRQGIVLARGKLEVHWMRICVFICGFTGAMWTWVFTWYFSSRKLPQSHLTAVIYNGAASPAGQARDRLWA
jgi:hypothetical protein